MMTLSDTRLARFKVNLARKLTWKTCAQIKMYHCVLNDQQVFRNDFRFMAVPFPTPQAVPASHRYGPLGMVGAAWETWCRKGSGQGCWHRASCAAHSVCVRLAGAWDPLGAGSVPPVRPSWWPGEWLETFMDL